MYSFSNMTIFDYLGVRTFIQSQINDIIFSAAPFGKISSIYTCNMFVYLYYNYKVLNQKNTSRNTRRNMTSNISM